MMVRKFFLRHEAAVEKRKARRHHHDQSGTEKNGNAVSPALITRVSLDKRLPSVPTFHIIPIMSSHALAGG